MDSNAWYALLAPAFLALVGLEAFAAWRRGRRIHDLADTIGNLGCGAVQVLCGLFVGAGVALLYEAFRVRCALITWSDDSWAPFLLAYLGIEVCYYAWHRASHALPVLWLFHAPHHQSREMNLSVAVRQHFLSDISAIPFFAPVPLLGVPLEVFGLTVGLMAFYEALMHTELVDGSPLLGRVFNRPAFHRLHHATNPRYREKNFGLSLVLWDRLFGTAVDEVESPVYGGVPGFDSANPVWAQLAPLAMHLGVTPAPPGARRMGPFPAVLHAALLAASSLALFALGPALPWTAAALATSWVLAGMVALGGMLDGRRWALAADVAWVGAGALLLGVGLPSWPNLALAGP